MFQFRCVVWTGDGRVFFYNPSTRTSVWERPEDLLGRTDVDKAISTAPDKLTVSTQSTKDEKQQVEIVVETSSKRSESESNGESDDAPNKKIKLDIPNGMQK